MLALLLEPDLVCELVGLFVFGGEPGAVRKALARQRWLAVRVPLVEAVGRLRMRDVLALDRSVIHPGVWVVAVVPYRSDSAVPVGRLLAGYSNTMVAAPRPLSYGPCLALEDAQASCC